MYNIEILSIGGDFNRLISECCQVLNGVQDEFRFSLPPNSKRSYGLSFTEKEYHAGNVFSFLGQYRKDTKGFRPYVIGVIDQKLRSDALTNLFGSHDARRSDGDAVVTLSESAKYSDSQVRYLCYYLVRYSLSFVCPHLRTHEETRSCFFDKKITKSDITLSMNTGSVCSECRQVLWREYNEDIMNSIVAMMSVLKSINSSSTDSLPARCFHGEIDVGIITIREDEFERVLDKLPARRYLVGSGANYEYSRIAGARSDVRVAVTRSPDQGQTAAQAVAFSLIMDLAPSWIFVVGIAGGFEGAEATLGDVLISHRMHDFSVTAAVEGKAPTFQDMGGPMALEVEALVAGLKGRRASLAVWVDEIGMEKPTLSLPPEDNYIEMRKSFYSKDASVRLKTSKWLRSRFPGGVGGAPNFYSAPIVTGNTLLKDTKLAAQWRTHARHASGVEMELGGVCSAARRAGGGKIKVLPIRGISDIVGYARSGAWTEYACRSAAAFTITLLRSGLVETKR